MRNDGEAGVNRTETRPGARRAGRNELEVFLASLPLLALPACFID
jgi:hypothetical protein